MNDHYVGLHELLCSWIFVLKVINNLSKWVTEWRWVIKTKEATLGHSNLVDWWPIYETTILLEKQSS